MDGFSTSTLGKNGKDDCAYDGMRMRACGHTNLCMRVGNEMDPTEDEDMGRILER